MAATNGTSSLSQKLKILLTKHLVKYFMPNLLISERFATSAAIGYLHEFLRAPAVTDSSAAGFIGNLYNPFFVVAHRWNNNWHTLLYAGSRHTAASITHTTWENNLSFHYMLSGTPHFIGLKFNQEITDKRSTVTYRPQIRLQLSHNLLVGLVAPVLLRLLVGRVDAVRRADESDDHVATGRLIEDDFRMADGDNLAASFVRLIGEHLVDLSLAQDLQVRVGLEGKGHSSTISCHDILLDYCRDSTHRVL